MKRFLIFCFVLLLSAGFVFASGGNQQAASTGTGAGAAVDYGKRTDGPNYWWVKFDQPVTIHTVNTVDPAARYMPGDSRTSNEWTRGWKEALNVEVVTDWVTEAQGFWEKLNLAAAANELPDVFHTTSAIFRQLVEAGVTADITDYIENNFSDYVKAIMAAAPTYTETAKYDGRFMGMPKYNYGELWNITPYTWIRHDWMVASGLPEPKTIEDLEKIMDSFMAAHPGAHGIGVRRTLEEFFWLAPAWGALPKTWIEKDGALVLGTVQPEMKLALAKFAEWYKKGYLKRDFMSQDARATYSDYAAGRVGVQPQVNSAGWQWTEGLKGLNSREAYMEPYETPSATGKPIVVPMPVNTEYIVINKNAKNIPAILKCISYHTWVVGEAALAGDMTPEQVDRYLMGGQGRHEFPALALHDPYSNGPAMVEWAHAIGLNNYQITEPAMFSEWNAQMEQAAPWWRDNSFDGYGRWIQQYNPRSSAWIGYNVHKEGRFVADRMTAGMPTDVASYGTTLDDLLTEGFTKIIVGQEPLSYFETLVAEWKASGGDVVTASINRQYGK